MSPRPFTGEFLANPVPIHIDLDACSNGCWYCFANLNNPKRLADYRPMFSAMSSFLRRDPPGKNLVKMLLAQGHPVLASNTSDPFAASTWPKFEPFWQACQDAGIPVCLQTRGGKAAMATIARCRPTMVYISITSDDEDRLRLDEPGAPGFSERQELLLAAKQAGHFVVVGLNPFHHTWWRDPSAFAHWLADHDLRHVWWGWLHLNYQQVANIGAKARQRHADDITQAMKKSGPHSQSAEAMAQELNDLGINTFFVDRSAMGKFWEPYFKLFPFFPTLEGFLDNLRAANQGHPVCFSFNYFATWADPAPGFQSSECKDYLTGFGRSIRNTKERPRAYSYREALAWQWRWLEFPTRLYQNDFFRATDPQDPTTYYTSSDGLPLMIWDPSGNVASQAEYPLTDDIPSLNSNHLGGR